LFVPLVYNLSAGLLVLFPKSTQQFKLKNNEDKTTILYGTKSSRRDE